MSIQTDYAEALETQNFWKFLLIHGSGAVSVSSGEKMPEEALGNEHLKKNIEIYEAYQLAKKGDATELLKHGDGFGDSSAKNSEKLNPEINDILFHYKIVSNGASALNTAAAQGQMAWVKKCVEEMKVTEGKEKAIDSALKQGHLEVAQYLYEKGAKLYHTELSVCHDEKTRAWMQGELKKELYESYDDPTYTAYPMKENHFFCTGVWVEGHFDKKCIQPLLRAIELGDLEFIKASLIQTSLPDREQALLFATKEKLLPTIKFLHQQGVSLNPVRPFTKSALHEAISGGDESIIDYFLSSDINVDTPDNRRNTPFMGAVMMGDARLARKLLAKGSDSKLRAANGNNVFHLAVENNKPEMVKLLLEVPDAQALLTQKNIYGETPLDRAIKDKQDELIKLLDPAIDLEHIKKPPSMAWPLPQ